MCPLARDHDEQQYGALCVQQKAQIQWQGVTGVYL